MKITQNFIRGISLLAITLAFFHIQPKLETEIPAYFQSEEEYYQFLEDIEGPGQGLGQISWEELKRSSAQPMKNLSWDQPTLKRVISLRVATKSWKPEEIEDLANFIVVMSYRYKVPPPVVLAMIEVESHFRRGVVSNAGAVGLMQLKPSTASYLSKKYHRKWSGAKSLRDPKKNIELGLMYMNYLSKKFSKPHWVFSAYNIGPVALKKRLYRKQPMSYRYFRKIMHSYRVITQQINPVATAAL